MHPVLKEELSGEIMESVMESPIKIYSRKEAFEGKLSSSFPRAVQLPRQLNLLQNNPLSDHAT